MYCKFAPAPLPFSFVSHCSNHCLFSFSFFFSSLPFFANLSKIIINAGSNAFANDYAKEGGGGILNIAKEERENERQRRKRRETDNG